MSASQKEHLSRKEAALHLSSLGYPISAETLSRLANRRRGPPYIRFLGRIVRYRRSVLEAWAAEQVEHVEW